MDVLDIVAPDQSGARTMAAFEYQAEVILAAVVQMVHDPTIADITCEHLEDFVVTRTPHGATAPTWDLQQVKSTTTKAPWTLARIIRSKALRSLWRTHRHLLNAAVPYTLTLVVEGQIATDSEPLAHRRGAQCPATIAHIAEYLTVDQQDAAAFLDLLQVREAPARSVIPDVTAQTIARARPDLTNAQTQALYQHLMDMVRARCSAPHPTAVGAPAHPTGKRITRADLLKALDHVQRTPHPTTPPGPRHEDTSRTNNWPRADSWSAQQAGVLPARPSPACEPALPPYIARDLDTRLADALARAAAQGGGVLVIGDSGAGKTRALYEALRTTLPEYLVAVAASPVELSALAAHVRLDQRPTVVWMDDLKRFAQHPQPMDATTLQTLTEHRIPLLATIRTEDFQPTEADPRHPPGAGPTARHLQELMRHLWLDRLWSKDERDRARHCADLRLTQAAAQHPRSGVAEYLAAGPLLAKEWKAAWRPGAHPRAAALIQTAVDFARTGVPIAITREELERHHHYYLARNGGQDLRPEDSDEAFAWASQLRLGSTALLHPAPDGHSWRAAPELLEAVHADPSAPPIPTLLWSAALLLPDLTPQEWWHLALNASRDAPQLAQVFWQKAGEDGSPLAANQLAALHLDQGRPEQAEQVLRTLCDQSTAETHINLGLALAATGRTTEAQASLQHAAELGSASAWTALAGLELEAGNPQEAEALLRRGVAANDLDASYNLAVLLAKSHRIPEALEAYGPPADAGDPWALHNRGMLQADSGLCEEALQDLRRAVYAGHREAGLELANTLKRTGRQREAEDMYWTLIADSDPRAAFNLANLYRDQARPHDAAAAYRRAAAAGQHQALLNHGIMAHKQGDLPAAEALLTQALDAGDPGASLHLGLLLQDLGREEDALAIWRDAARKGDTTAALGVVAVLSGSSGDHSNEIETALRRAAQADDPDAIFQLIVHLHTLVNEHAPGHDGDSAVLRREITSWWQQLAKHGAGVLCHRVGIFLEAVGNLPDAERYYESAASTGLPEAQWSLAEFKRRHKPSEA